MKAKLLVAARAARDLLVLAGAVALGAFYGVERAWMWLLPMSALVAAIAAVCYRIELARASRRAARHEGLAAAHRRAKAALAASRGGARPAAAPAEPRPDQKRWLLTEDEIPVAIETNQRAAENWMGLGERHDAVAFEPPAWRARKAALRRDRRARGRREAQMDQFDEEHAR
jgi:hypothetical protein